MNRATGPARSFRHSLAFKFMLGVTSVLFIAQVAAALILAAADDNERHVRLQSDVQSELRFLVALAPERIILRDFFSLDLLIREITSNPEIVYALVVGNDGQPLSSYLDLSNPYLAAAVEQAGTNAPIPVIQQALRDPDIAEVSAPVIVAGRTASTVRVGYTLALLRDGTNRVLARTFVGTAVLSLLLAGALMLVFNVVVRDPLQGISSLAGEYALGRLDRRASLSPSSELAELQSALNIMAERLEKQVVELSLLSQVANRTDNLVIITDSEGGTEWVNPAFVRRTGFTLEEMRGHPPRDFLVGVKTDVEFLIKMNQLISQEKGYDINLELRTKAGEDFDAAIESRAVTDDHGQLRNVIVVMRDMTEQRKAEDQIRSYAESLERSNSELEGFAYIASHDLQEPLRKVQAFGSRLDAHLNGILDERGRDYLQRMQDAAQRMQILINDLLSFSRVATKAQPPQVTDLNVLITDVLSDLEVLVEQTRGTVEVAPLMPLCIDPSQISQVFQNVIGNALKFSHPDRLPKISISGRVLSETIPPTYEIAVVDNGIGFEERYSDRIFQIFQRLHSRTDYEGTGVGLAICRKIVERHGGTLSAEGRPDQGATFLIRLPLVANFEETGS